MSTTKPTQSENVTTANDVASSSSSSTSASVPASDNQVSSASTPTKNTTATTSEAAAPPSSASSTHSSSSSEKASSKASSSAAASIETGAQQPAQEEPKADAQDNLPATEPALNEKKDTVITTVATTTTNDPAQNISSMILDSGPPPRAQTQTIGRGSAMSAQGNKPMYVQVVVQPQPVARPRYQTQPPKKSTASDVDFGCMLCMFGCCLPWSLVCLPCLLTEMNNRKENQQAGYGDACPGQVQVDFNGLMDVMEAVGGGEE